MQFNDADDALASSFLPNEHISDVENSLLSCYHTSMADSMGSDLSTFLSVTPFESDDDNDDYRRRCAINGIVDMLTADAACSPVDVKAALDVTPVAETAMWDLDDFDDWLRDQQSATESASSYSSVLGEAAMPPLYQDDVRLPDVLCFHCDNICCTLCCRCCQTGTLSLCYLSYSVDLCSISFHLRNDLYCVGWGVKLYSLTLVISYVFLEGQQMRQMGQSESTS